MNILCINYEYPPIGGGGGVACHGLVEHLAKNGHQIDVVTSGMKDLPEYEEVDGFRIHRVRCVRRFRHYVTLPELLVMIPFLYKKALDLVKNNSYELNHTHFIFPSGIISYLLWRKTGLPYIITSHGSDVPSYNPDRFHLSHKILKILWKKIVANSVGLSTPSLFLKQLINDNIDTSVEVIPYGFDCQYSFEKNAKRNRILVVTRIFRRKGVQFFLKAMADLKTDWEVLVVGDGPYLAKLKKIAVDLPSVRFLGYVQGKELDGLYRSSKIFVFPSIQENFPVVLLEAMAAGCAIITTDACGCKEVVGDAAIRTECGSVSGIQKALKYLLENEHEIERLSQSALERVAEFSWTKIVARYEQLSNQCIGKLKPMSLRINLKLLSEKL